MPLQEVKPGRYERPFDTLESLYRNVAATGAHLQKEHYFISSVIQLQRHNAVPVRDLQQAWKALRHLHPKIAAVPDETGSRLVYTVPSPEDLEKWLQETFVVHSCRESRSAESLDVVLLPSPLFMVHYLPSSGELLFRASHWHIDGIGMIMLQDAFLTLLAQGPQAEAPVFDGSEVSRFPPSLDEAAGISLDITDEMKKSTETELSALSAASSAPAASLSDTLPNTTKVGNTRRTSTRFSKELTRQIIAASKHRGLKVTAAVQAALVLTARRHMTPLNGRLNCFGIYNLRNRLPAPWNNHQGAAGLYHTGRICSIDMGVNKDYSSIAGFLRSYYEQDLQPMFGYMAYHLQRLGALLSTPLGLSIQDHGAARPELISIGVVDDRLKTRYTGARATVEIDDWWLGVQTTNRLLPMYVWTRGGELHFSCHYNDAFYEREFVEGFLGEWKSCLVDKLLG